MRLPRGQYGHSWRSWVRRLSSRIARSRYFSRISSSVAGIRPIDLDGTRPCPFHCIKRCPAYPCARGMTGEEDPELRQRIGALLDSPGGYPAFKDALGKLGYDVKVREKKWPITPPWDVASIQKRGLSPRTVIDVGAARGTQPLYEAFPDAYLVLVEPLGE